MGHRAAHKSRAGPNHGLTWDERSFCSRFSDARTDGQGNGVPTDVNRIERADEAHKKEGPQAPEEQYEPQTRPNQPPPSPLNPLKGHKNTKNPVSRPASWALIREQASEVTAEGELE